MCHGIDDHNVVTKMANNIINHGRCHKTAFNTDNKILTWAIELIHLHKY